MSTLALVLGCVAIGAAFGFWMEARRDRDRARAELAAAATTAVLRVIETRELQHAFADYIEERGVDPDDDLPQVFAEWLANHTGETVVARQVDGDGIVIAIPDPEED